MIITHLDKASVELYEANGSTELTTAVTDDIGPSHLDLMGNEIALVDRRRGSMA